MATTARLGNVNANMYASAMPTRASMNDENQNRKNRDASMENPIRE